jgi:hypothetical protein
MPVRPALFHPSPGVAGDKRISKLPPSHPRPREHPSRQRLADRAELTVIVLAFRAIVVFGSYGVKSAVLSVRR